METLDGVVKHPEGTGASPYWRCPKCGATLEKDANLSQPHTTPDGPAICSRCSAEFAQADVSGGKFDVTPPPMSSSSPGRNPLALVVAALVAAGMLYFGFHMARRSGTTTPRISKATVAPDFTLESLDGKNMRLSDLRGHAVLLNFWATWCGPCKIEMPWFVDLQNKYGAQGLQIVGVAMDDASKEDIAKFAKDMGVNYPILVGKESVGDQYGGIPALPETFFIGRDGKVIDKIIGLKGKSDIEDDVKKALNTQPAASQGFIPPSGPMQAQK